MNAKIKERLKKIKLYLLDMDGTVYLDDDVFPGTIDFVNTLSETKKEYVFLTNNSSKSHDDYLLKLRKLNIPATDTNIFTSGEAAGIYLQTRYPGKRVFAVGTQSLIRELKKFSVKLTEENPEIVLIGFDRELTYKKLEKACSFIDNGALFLATNCDAVCPVAGKRYLPDCGSICSMVTNATGKEPFYLGKPNPLMINLMKEKYRLPADKIAVIGDRIYTDIVAGYNAGVYTICVLSGEATLETIEKSKIKPDLIVPSVKDLIPLIKI